VAATIRKLRPELRNDVWNRAYRKALKDYGNKAQAERIAWQAIDQVQAEPPSGTTPAAAKKRASALKRVA
jgi:hypothetical protein